MTVLDFLFPKRCVGCGNIGKYVCDQCRKRIHCIAPNEAVCPVCERLAVDGATHPRCRGRYALDGLISFFRYDGVVRKAIKALKYRYVSDLALEFVSLVPRESLGNLHGTLFVPIPLHPARLRSRGFNQAEVLGVKLAERLHTPASADILKRVKKTIPQVEMRDRKSRLGNMDKVFAANEEAVKEWDTIILFDDVFTTGATMRAAGNALKRAGAKRVWAVTMAR